MTPAKGRKRRRGGFYADGAPAREEGAEGQAQEWAEEIIAALRARVAELMRGRPEDVGLVLKSAHALLRSALAEKKLSGRSGRDLGENMRRVLDSLGPLILPAEDEGREVNGS